MTYIHIQNISLEYYSYSKLMLCFKNSYNDIAIDYPVVEISFI